MGLKEIFGKLKNNALTETTHEGLDGETEDKRLLTLRKMKRKLDEQDEKKRLIKHLRDRQIASGRFAIIGDNFLRDDVNILGKKRKKGKVGANYFR